MSTYQLVVQKGPQEGQTYPLSKDNMTVGRDPMCDIVINDPEISRQHARFTQTEAGYQLQDLGSTNGSFIDGKRLAGETVLLASGQIVKMGSAVSLRYEVIGSDPMATVLSPNILADLSMPTESELKMPPQEQSMPDFAAPTAQSPHDNEPAPLPAYDNFPAYEAPAEQRTMLDSDLPSFGSSSSSNSFSDLPNFDSSSSTSSSSSVPVFTPQMTGGSTPPPPPAAPSSGSGGLRNNRNVIIAVVVVVLLCCCCVTVGLLYQYGDAIMTQLGMVPNALPLLASLI